MPTIVSARKNSNLAVYSTDGGATWVQRTLPLTLAWGASAYGSGVFCIMGLLSAAAVTSTDGVTWTARTLPTSGSWKGIAHNKAIFLACDAVDGKVIISPDGAAWSQPVGGGIVAEFVVCLGAMFVAVDQLAKKSWRTSDGLSWAQSAFPADTGYVIGMVSTGTVICGLEFNTGKVVTSTDGIVWTRRDLPAVVVWGVIGVNNLGFYILTGGSAGYTSPDGAVWTARSTPSLDVDDQGMASSIYNGVSTVALSFGNGSPVVPIAVLSSTDGSAWTSAAFPIAYNGSGGWETMATDYIYAPPPPPPPPFWMNFNGQSETAV